MAFLKQLASILSGSIRALLKNCLIHGSSILRILSPYSMRYISPGGFKRLNSVRSSFLNSRCLGSSFQTLRFASLSDINPRPLHSSCDAQVLPSAHCFQLRIVLPRRGPLNQLTPYLMDAVWRQHRPVSVGKIRNLSPMCHKRRL